MNHQSVKNSIENIDTDINRFIEVANSRMAKAEAAEIQLIASFGESVYNKIDLLTLPITRVIYGLSQRANYTIIRVTFHASPEIVTLLLAMVTIYRIITFAIKMFNVIRIIGTVWKINQIIVSLWPRYRDWFNGLLVQVSQMSGYLGWGVDGIGHLINACSGGINVVGGLMGKDWNFMRLEIMERSNELVVQMSRMLTQLKEDPGGVLNQLFENRTLLSAYDANKWWGPIAETISIASDRAETAMTGIQGVIGELQEIQNDMPEVVRQHIPASIWSGLEKADSTINTYILPQIWTINRSLQFMDAILNASLKRGSELADKLAHPGEILLGVDDLPDYAKGSQLNMIDDVTSREFDFWSDQERTELGPDLDEFDRIDRLATAPTSSPPFMALESAARRKLTGITVEPQETWFVGNY